MCHCSWISPMSPNFYKNFKLFMQPTSKEINDVVYRLKSLVSCNYYYNVKEIIITEKQEIKIGVCMYNI